MYPVQNKKKYLNKRKNIETQMIEAFKEGYEVRNEICYLQRKNLMRRSLYPQSNWALKRFNGGLFLLFTRLLLRCRV